MKILYLFMPIMLFAQAGMPSIMLDSDFRLNTPLYQSPIKVREVVFSRPFKRFCSAAAIAPTKPVPHRGWLAPLFLSTHPPQRLGGAKHIAAIFA